MKTMMGELVEAFESLGGELERVLELHPNIEVANAADSLTLDWINTGNTFDEKIRRLRLFGLSQAILAIETASGVVTPNQIESAIQKAILKIS